MRLYGVGVGALFGAQSDRIEIGPLLLGTVIVALSVTHMSTTALGSKRHAATLVESELAYALAYTALVRIPIPAFWINAVYAVCAGLIGLDLIRMWAVNRKSRPAPVLPVREPAREPVDQPESDLFM
jgi:hypothetical protein